MGTKIITRFEPVDGAELAPFTWIVHKHQAKSGYLSRSGLHRILAWPFLFKNYAVRDLAEFLEIYGLPLRLGKYPSGASPDDATASRTAAESATDDANTIGRGSGHGNERSKGWFA